MPSASFDPRDRVSAPRHLTNGALYLLAAIIGRLQFFVTLPFVSRYITPAEYGIVTLANVIATFAATTVAASVSGAVERFYAITEGVERARYLGSIYTYLLISLGIMGLLALLSTPVWAPGLVPSHERLFPVFAIAIGTALVSVLNSFAISLSRIEERPGFALAVGLTRFAVGATTVVLALALWHGGVRGYLLALAVVEVAVMLGTLAYVLRRVDLGLRPGQLKQIFAFSLPLVPYVGLVLARDLGDRWILQQRVPLDRLGIYGMAWGLAGAVNMVVSSLSVPYAAIMMKRVGSSKAESEMTHHLNFLRPMAADVLVLTLAAYGALLLVVQDFARVVLAPSYHEAWRVAALLGLVYVFRALYLFPHNALYWFGRTRAVPLATAAGVAVGLPFIWFGTPVFGVAAGAIGVALTYLIAWLVAGWALPSRAWMFPIRRGPVALAALGLALVATLVLMTTELPTGQRLGLRLAGGMLGGLWVLSWLRSRRAGFSVTTPDSPPLPGSEVIG